jgi:hypothetical protein
VGIPGDPCCAAEIVHVNFVAVHIGGPRNAGIFCDV